MSSSVTHPPCLRMLRTTDLCGFVAHNPLVLSISMVESTLQIFTVREWLKVKAVEWELSVGKGGN